MILYRNNSSGFREHVDSNCIVKEIEQTYIEKMGRKPTDGERRSWNNSSRFMETVVRKSRLPDDCGILIEYNIPSTMKRIDFVITGHDESDKSNFLIIELKQWEYAKSTDKEDLVITRLNGHETETTHPAYQAHSYKRYLYDMNEAVYEGDITAVSCAYLHNYEKKEPEPLLEEQYQEIVTDTPVFFSSDVEKLEDFIRRHVGKGKGMEILYEVENGKIRPSKKLINCVSDLFKSNPIYTLLDEQKVAYSNIMNLALKQDKKTAIVIYGGPGTGKSVVAMNVLVKLLDTGLNVRYISPNAAFKESLIDTLAKKKVRTKKRLLNIFSGSGSYWSSYTNEFDVLICDEAHRLKRKGSYMYDGESQVEDLVKSARVSVFFVDENQMIRPDDEGSIEKIKEACKKYGADYETVELKAQFRCSGAEGYLNWVEHTLQIRDTANYDGWEKEQFEFKIFDNPNDLYQEVCKRNDGQNKARMLAGFAWKWSTNKEGNDNAQIGDVNIPEWNFSMPWNSHKNQYTWGIDDSKKNQIGCIHTSQGLEFEYVGVIIGKDLRYDPETMKVYASYNDYKDSKGKTNLKDDNETLTNYIKNIYRVLMSRGMKGCFIYCDDKNLQNYFKERANQ